jgi:hypothetical protein
MRFYSTPVIALRRSIGQGVCTTGSRPAFAGYWVMRLP